MSDWPIASLTGRKLLAELPDYYDGIQEMRMIMEAEGSEFDGLADSAASVANQAFVETATWSILRWERAFGLAPEAGKPLGQRRSAVLSKIRGYGTATAPLIKRVAESFQHGEVAVAVHPPTYEVTIAFVSMIGTPPNIADIQRAIDDVLPVHLAPVYVFMYLRLSQVEQMTLAELEDAELDHFAY